MSSKEHNFIMAILGQCSFLKAHYSIYNGQGSSFCKNMCAFASCRILLKINLNYQIQLLVLSSMSSL